jgi:hypothetical protein
MAALYERRTGPRKVAIPQSVAPYSQVNAVLPGHQVGPASNRFVRSEVDPGPLPPNDGDIAFAPVWQLSRWIESRKLSSERLTNIYLERIVRFDPKLRCVITPTRDLGLAQARKADQEIASGRYRGPLHGIPFGVKDLLDTAGIPTTYGAEPYRDRVPKENAVLVARLEEAGAVLIAKLSPRCAGAQRYLVRRPDDEPVAARGGFRGIQRGTRRRHGRRACRLFHWQRNRGQHRRSQRALRGHGPPSHIWARAPYWRDDAVLVAR